MISIFFRSRKINNDQRMSKYLEIDDINYPNKGLELIVRWSKNTIGKLVITYRHCLVVVLPNK